MMHYFQLFCNMSLWFGWSYILLMTVLYFEFIRAIRHRRAG